MEYIERESLLADIDDLYLRGKVTLKECILNQPAADVVPVVRGDWIGEIAFERMEISMQECKVCHKIRPIDNFCGNCGADMRQRRE